MRRLRVLSFIPVVIGLLVVGSGCTPAENADTRDAAAPAASNAEAAPANPDKAKSLPGPATRN